MNQERNLATSLGVLTGVTLLFGGVEPVAAAIITDNANFSLTQPPTGTGPAQQTDTQSLDLFNPALGTLTAVRFILDSEVLNKIVIQVDSGNQEFTASGSAASQATFALNLVTPYAAFINSGGSMVPVSCNALGTCMDMDQSAGPYDASVPNWNPPDFTGVGTFDVQFDIIMEITGQCGEITEECLILGNAKWEGTFTVEYTYDPANGNGTEVPEPASATLLGGGLAALAALRRRRQG